MGAAGSRLEKALGEQFPEGERYFGLENFGNTCYCNSVLQVRKCGLEVRNRCSSSSRLAWRHRRAAHRPCGGLGLTRRCWSAPPVHTSSWSILVDVQADGRDKLQLLGVASMLIAGRFTRSAHEDKKSSILLMELLGSYLAESSLLDYACLRFVPSVVAALVPASVMFVASLTIDPNTNPWALYFCVPFRDQLLQYYANSRNTGDVEENMLTCLADLFSQISNQKKKTGVIAPKRFIQRLKKQNEIFRSYMHQDAHEFLNFLLNELVDILEKEHNAARESLQNLSSQKNSNGPIDGQPNGSHKELAATWVHKCFQGILTNETRCLRCETVTDRDETFFDLSLDIEQNSSLTSCLKNFSSTETLNAEDKFFCDKCCSLQEAQKRMKIKKPPNILVIHLKRFKYIEQLQRYKKLSYRVVFPLELKLLNTVDNSDLEYSLFAVVVHVGSGPNHGHYISLVKSHNHWLFFDDENVEMTDESMVQAFFGSPQEFSGNTDNGYILFYESLAERS